MRISDWSSDVCSSDLRYPILFRAICPDDWTEETIDWTEVRDEIVRVHGAKRMITVLAGGQDFEPTGLNYTGSGPSRSRRTVAELLPRIFAKSKKIAFIAWHTGLGQSGEIRHLCSFAPGTRSEARRVGKEWFRRCSSRGTP